MRNLKLALIIGIQVLVFSSLSYGQSAQSLMERDIKTGMKTTIKPLRLYHYFFMPTPQGGAKIDPWFMEKANRRGWVADMISARAGAFWDFNV